jgi:hypothetical protein
MVPAKPDARIAGWLYFLFVAPGPPPQVSDTLKVFPQPTSRRLRKWKCSEECS